MVRELKHPVVEIEGHDEGVLVRFYAPGSKFGPVEIVLSLDEAERLAEDVSTAVTFEGTEGRKPVTGPATAPMADPATPWEFTQDDVDARRGVARVLNARNELVCETTPDNADLIVCAVGFLTAATLVDAEASA